MPNHFYILLIPLLPLTAFLVLGLFGRKYLNAAAGIIGTVALLAAAVLACITAYSYFSTGKVNGVYQQIVAFKYTWLQFSPNVSIDMGFLLDPISVMMIVIVTFISLMVHVFSLGYMKGEGRLAAYYAFLSLFTFSMLGLVLSSNIFQLYIFWELVGVSSYLLIGFYFDKPSAVAASKKAFIVTRFADLGFLVGILILAFNAETLDFGILIERLTNTQSSWSIAVTSASFMGVSVLTWGLVLVFAGGAGKSAMFPLHIWLPDAMEGPTPVSALIHAATMVVAGVYLVARLFPVFAIDGAALNIVAYVGASSALIAAVIACTQTDIKRVLAYSTMSQIGYMMFALGVSKYGGEDGLGYMASMFHLFTHAFFKSLLFLGAGAVIHMVHSNEMKDMGGLRKLMPVTHASFLIACLAIAGIPPFSGFFSKEEILLAAFNANKAIYAIGLFTSVLTAFYMFRLYFSIFWSKQNAPSLQRPGSDGGGIEIHHTHEEGTITMKLPLIILTAGAVLAGFVPFSGLVTTDGAPLETHIDIIFSIAPVTLAIAAILLAAGLYKKENDKPQKMAASLGGFYRSAYKKFYIDEIYLFITKKIIFNAIGRPAAWIDKNIVDGLMNGIATATATTARVIKGIQSGKIQNYTLYFFAGIAGLAVMVIYLWKQ
ncbi:MAG TPA: NADH-quinone oxidoreductase subunit L [Chitinophagaceae bacterium]|nr:NADH-quinone oxidoreductase subunit L [Chitinophagaceae bacterium]